ncbi:ribosomal protein S18 [Trichoderma aethiopicum]
MPPLLPTPAVRGLSIRSFSTSPASALRDTFSNRPSSSSSLLSINNSSSSSSSSSPRPSYYNNNYNNNKYRSNQQQNQGNPGDAASSMLTRLKRDGLTTLRSKQAQIEQLRNQKNSADYLRQMPRRWEAGDVYSPHDMSPVEMQKWRKRSPRKADVVDALGIRPLDMYKNFSLIQEFTSTSGQITHSSGTSLRPVNQRKIAKMIRRVQGMGLYPTIHAHPEMIRDNFFPERR